MSHLAEVPGTQEVFNKYFFTLSHWRVAAIATIRVPGTW